MKIFKPSWVHHDDQPIFSLDVHPDSSRFATGGQGQDSGKIIIWNMGPLVDGTKENDENAPKILCQMDHHIACVNVVRWSNNGFFLASGSDDKLIMIWQFVHGMGSYQNIENWKCGFTLRGHSGDVMDLSWSAKDNLLASCSVDNTIIIWNALKFPDIIHRINAHAGLVKGVAWDPVGTFFASQSDDKTLKIWKTLDWSLEKVVDGPFKQCTGTTHVLRLNWSPDGQLIVSAHAINNGAPTAQVIDRNKWSTKIDFVGHRKAVTTVRFFPQILKPYDADGKTNFKTHCLSALGSRDRSISIWLTNYQRPLFVLHDSFDNPIMDLSWSKQPKPGLLACSMDGSVSYIEFEYKEVGRPLTREETSEFFMKKYNHDINAFVPTALKNSNTQQMNIDVNGSQSSFADQKTTQIKESSKFVENFDVLLAQEQKEKQQQLLSNQSISQNSIQNENSFNTNTNMSTNSTTMTPSKQAMLIENQKQIERRLPDGRRRITPICVCKPGDFDTPMPFGSLNSFNKLGFAQTLGFGSSQDGSLISRAATEPSTIIIEKRDEKGDVVEVSPIKSIVYKPSYNGNSNSNDSKFAPNEVKSQNNDKPPMTSISTKSISEPMDTSNNSGNRIEIPQKAIQKQIENHQINRPNKTVSAKTASEPISKSTQLSTTITTTPSSISTHNNSNVSNKPNQKLVNTTKTNSSIIASNSPMTTNYKIASDTNISKTPVNKVNTPLKTISDSQKIHHGNVHLNNFDDQNYFNYLKPIDVITEKSLTKIIKRDNPSEIVKIQNSISLVEKSSLPTNLQSHNEADHQINCLKYLKNDLFKWQVYFYSRICEVNGTSNLIFCVCEDSTIHFFKAQNGTQICCPIALDSRAAVLKSNGNYCLCMTSSGYIYIWKYTQETYTQNQDMKLFTTSIKNVNDDSNIQNLTTIINRESCQFILKNGEWLDCEITDTGVPIISMSKNRSYFFSLKTKSWHLLPCMGTIVGKESQLLLNSNTMHANSKSFGNSNNLTGPLSQIQSRNKNSSILKAIETLNKTTASFSKQDFTLTHLESQVNAAIGLNSPKEYKFWLMTLVRYLVENNYEEKLTEICNFFLGPCYSVNWNHTFLTYIKRDLLKEIILIIAQNLNLQRVYSFYKQQLQLIDSLNSKNSVLDRLVSSNRQETSLRKSISSSKSFLEVASKDLEAKKITLEEESDKITNKISDNQMEIQILNETEQIHTNLDIELKSNEIDTQKILFKMPDIPVQTDLRNENHINEEVQLQALSTDNNEILLNKNNIELKL